jgi:hypothetical protein
MPRRWPVIGVRDAFVAERGVEVDTQGDAFSWRF